MNTEKKAKILIICGLIIVILVSLFCFGLTASSTAEAEGKQYRKQNCATYDCMLSAEEVFPEYSYEKEGYQDFKTWWEDLLEERKSWEGKAEKTIEEYDEFLSDTQKEKLSELEKNILNATNFTKLKNYTNAFNNIVNKVEEKKKESEELAALQTQSNYQEYKAAVSSGSYSGSYYDFLRDGVVNSNGCKFTYYSQSVLPGGGLNIPGRHVNGGFVCDEDGYIVLANSAPNGTVIDTPWGPGKVYDKGTSGNHYDVYVE